MTIEKYIEEWFKDHDTIPTVLMSGDIGCDTFVTWPAVASDAGGEVTESFDHVLKNIKEIFLVHSASDALDYLKDTEVIIKRGPDMTRQEWKDMGEFDGC